MNKEELMKWLQEQAQENEVNLRGHLDFETELEIWGRIEAYNHVWRYLNEQD